LTTTLPTFQLTFFVPGTPAAQGSKRHVGNGRMIEQSANVGPWRERIAIAAHNFSLENNRLDLPVTGRPLSATLKFVMPRLKSMKQPTPPPAIRRPDLDKMQRAVFDALTDIIYTDDAAIIDITATKRYAQPNETPGVHITVQVLP
jgi:crossover junction endodeoxyribonuclease RusA